MADVAETWRSEGTFDRLGAGTYDFVIQRPRLARPLGRVLWGADMTRVYGAIAAVGKVPDDSQVLDVPCGGGVAFRGLRPGQRVRYVAADISPGMLRRARRAAERLGLAGQIELVEANVESLPFEAETFDLCLCLNSLHCFADPAAALAEIGRVLKPEARLLCDCAILGEGRRFDRLYGFYHRRGVFGPGGTATDLRRWLEGSGFADSSIETTGAIAFVDARRGDGSG